MKLIVKLNNSRKTASVVYAGAGDFGFVNEWRKTLGDDTNPIRKDSLVFASLAVERFRVHSRVQHYVRSIEDIGDHIKNDPNSEVANIVLLKCDWFPDSAVIGCAHFRRTWSNNIILDYLATHPCFTGSRSPYPHQVRGVGKALLYFVSQVAERYDCGKIWGEATHLSYEYYNKAFKFEKAEDLVKDLIDIPRAKYQEFAERYQRYLAEKGDTVTPESVAFDEIDDIEITNPPFVGSKTAVFNPAYRLSCRFLDLSRHVQMPIVQSLGLLQNDDKDQPPAEQFNRFFQRAAANGKLQDFWRAVEKEYPDGEPDKNPFPI